MNVGEGRRPPTAPQFLAATDVLAVIEVVLRIVAEAWERVLRECALSETERHDEPRTAGLLRARMIAVEAERSPRRPPMKIKPEVGVTSEDQETVVGFIDIEIIYSLGDEPDLRLECKRVSSTKEDGPTRLANRYVRTGVLHFVGKYGRGHAWGIMIGFVVDGNAESAALLIARRVAKYANEPTHLLSDWCEEARFGAYRHLFNTRHRKSDGSPIELLHFFLSFPARRTTARSG